MAWRLTEVVKARFRLHGCGAPTATPRDLDAICLDIASAVLQAAGRPGFTPEEIEAMRRARVEWDRREALWREGPMMLGERCVGFARVAGRQCCNRHGRLLGGRLFCASHWHQAFSEEQAAEVERAEQVRAS
jgi:hypothetical protein